MTDESLVESLTLAIHTLRDLASARRWQLARADVPPSTQDRLRREADHAEAAADRLLLFIAEAIEADGDKATVTSSGRTFA